WVGQRVFSLALGEVEALQLAGDRAVRVRRRLQRFLEVIDLTGGPGGQAGVVSGRNRQRHDPLIDAIEVDDHGLGFFFFLGLVILGWFLVFVLRFVVLGLRFLLVALSGQRRWLAGLQDYKMKRAVNAHVRI